MNKFQKLVLRLLLRILDKLLMVPGVAEYDSDQEIEEEVYKLIKE